MFVLWVTVLSMLLVDVVDVVGVDVFVVDDGGFVDVDGVDFS